MAIVKMKLFRLIALEQDRAALLSRLQRLGCVEISESEGKLSAPEWAGLMRRETSSVGEVKTQVSQVTHALEALRKYAPVKSGLFTKRPFMTEEEFLDADAMGAALAISSTIGDSLSAITRLNTQENRLSGMKASLAPWSALPLPLNALSTEQVTVTMGVCPAVVSVDAVTSALGEAAPLSQLTLLRSDKELHYLLLLCHNSELAEAEEVLKSFAFSANQFKELSGTAAEEIARIQSKLDEIAIQRKAEEETIASFGDKRFALRHCLDQLNQILSRESARDHLLTDGTIIFLEGWAAETGRAKLEALLGEFPCAYSLEDPTTEQTPPTLLENPKWMKPINMVTEMYSLPAYHGGIDPNPLIFGFYIIFFGFMFADIGYGLILTLLCSIITKKYRPKKTMGYMFHLGIYLGISATFFGFLTGGFFSNSLTVIADTFFGKEFALPALFDPLSDPMKVLMIAICMGMVQLLVGQCIHIYVCARDGALLDGILDVVPWWVLFAGIGIFAAMGTAAGIWVGVVALVLTQGRHKKGIFGKLFGGIASLYDVTAWLSDILSYSRLMALMLAGTVIGSVFNILGALPGNALVYALVFVIGHIFNMGINIIGTYVHAARLQYLEFFSKFYKEGGIPFRPLAYQTTYTAIILEEET